MFTRTPGYVVPAFWGPITAAVFYRSIVQFVDPKGAGAQPMFSLALSSHHIVSSPFTFATPLSPALEPGAFQMAACTKTLPCFAIGFVIWTILEYVLHRFLLRLVMPPLLFTLLQAPFTSLGYALFSPAVANGIISGAFTMYIGYNCMHYALPCSPALSPRYLSWLTPVA
ncbi:unnamed protein product, partial [Tilletia controversa]